MQKRGGGILDIELRNKTNLIENYFHTRTNDYEVLNKLADKGLSYEEITNQIASQFSFIAALPLDLKATFKNSEQEIIDEAVSEYGNHTLDEIGINGTEASEFGLSPENTIKEALESSHGLKSQSLAANPVIVIILARLIKWALQELYKRFLKRYIDWFIFMTRPYKEITNLMLGHYAKIDLFVHHDMDMDSWYELGPSKYHPYEKEQVSRTSELARNSKGRLIPFYAYNPQKGIYNLIDAIETKGYGGVKFYPPSGYMPFGNLNVSWNISNERLYQYCEEKGVPIFTHCNDHGMEAYEGAGKNSDPDLWEQVLIEHPDLILCFGHAGGEKAWFNPDFTGDENEYARKVYELCVKYKNTYCDMGYFPLIYSKDGVDKLRTNLLQLFQRPLDGQTRKFDFSDKILYGSDWHMLMQENCYEDYFPAFVKLFNEDQYSEYYKKFFFSNSIRFLQLGNYTERNKDFFLTADGYRYLKSYILGEGSRS